MTRLALLASLALGALSACEASRLHEAPAPPSKPTATATATSTSGVAETPLDAGTDAQADAAPVRAQHEPDGNDDATNEPGASGPRLTSATLTKVGVPPLGLTRICDLRAFAGSLYAAHANQPLGSDGATLTRFTPDAAKPFAVAFDWNRIGEPTKGGGGGQGFLRVHALGGRLFVPDADPPYGGLGAVDWGTEGYVFVSDREGTFARARYPHAGLPGRPDADGKAGASVLPRAYHVLDVASYRGHLYASTGSVPPNERAWQGPAPGALHMATPDLSRFTYTLGFPSPYPGGVWRLTYLVRFRDSLYAGLQDFDGKSPFDYARFTLPEGRDVLREGDGVGKRVTDRGAAFTLRWYADRGALYWIAGTWGGPVTLRKTTDGDTWDTVDLPADVDRPTDVVRFGGELVVLTERALVGLGEGGEPARIIATITDKKSPFSLDDAFCAAPLGVLGGVLYAGGQRGGALYRFDPAPPPAPPP